MECAGVADFSFLECAGVANFSFLECADVANLSFLECVVATIACTLYGPTITSRNCIT